MKCTPDQTPPPAAPNMRSRREAALRHAVHSKHTTLANTQHNSTGNSGAICASQLHHWHSSWMLGHQTLGMSCLGCSQACHNWNEQEAPCVSLHQANKQQGLGLHCASTRGTIQSDVQGVSTSSAIALPRSSGSRVPTTCPLVNL